MIKRRARGSSECETDALERNWLIASVIAMLSRCGQHFLGATPQWLWFIPAVETAIAATVLYAAAAAYFRRMDSVAVIAGVGLLHGLGFSFVLGDILGRDAPNLIPALAAFNVGIEIGQLAIIAVTLATVAMLTRLSRAATPVLRNAALAGIAAMSAWWVIERGAALIA